METLNHTHNNRNVVVDTVVTLCSDPYSFGLMNWALCVVVAFVLFGFCNNAWLRYGTYVDKRRILSAERRCLISRVCGCRSASKKHHVEHRLSSTAGGPTTTKTAVKTTVTAARNSTAPQVEQPDAVVPVAKQSKEKEETEEVAKATTSGPRKTLPTSMRRRDRVNLTIDFPHTLPGKTPNAAVTQSEREGAAVSGVNTDTTTTTTTTNDVRMSIMQNSSYSWGDGTLNSAGGATDVFSDNSSVDSAVMSSGPSFTAIFSGLAAKTASFSSNPLASATAGSSGNNNNTSNNSNSRCFPVYTKEEQESMLKKREANAEALREAKRALETVEYKERRASIPKA